ncbi:chaperone required for assembly of F1-ATPase [Pectinatus haikarae]|uniref:Chaperone required for assembly of F1-ATPase n=1 Tax=Pectinatus haikarae TaxID=349096 RepID=A0ABT9YBA4_9FIRM|nr:chaperone required for assembly of F1-ATPase [Pectinatus haikarae]
MKHEYQINLATEERKKLLQILSKGKTSARLVKRDNILLALDGKDPKSEEAC